LLTTKLYVPRAHPNLVPRPRLGALLAEGMNRKLILISAPAGFGKTTLLVEWLRERVGGVGSVAGLSLDEGDNDPTRFLSYLVAALGTVQEGIGQGVLSSWRSPEPPCIEAMMAALINELAALPEDLTCVLDDYHLIE
jgi:LuxR family maltose regulon positive regulatory protein